MLFLKSNLYDPTYTITNFSNVNRDEKRRVLKSWTNNVIEHACINNFKDVFSMRINRKNINYELCLKLACENDNLEIAKFILEKGWCKTQKMEKYTYNVKSVEMMKLLKPYIGGVVTYTGGCILSNNPHVVDMIDRTHLYSHTNACTDGVYSLMNYYEAKFPNSPQWKDCLAFYVDSEDLKIVKYLCKKVSMDDIREVYENFLPEEPVKSYLKKYLGE